MTSPFFWILVLTIFLLRTILFTPGIPHHGDLTYPSTILQYQKELYPLWNESTSDSNLESIDRGFSLLLVLFVRLIGGDVDLLSKLYFFIPMFVSGVTTAFLTKFLLKKIQPDKQPNTIPVVVASLMYMISPWVLEQVQAPFFWLSYAVTPGIILLAYRFFTENRVKFGVGLAVLWTVASTTPQYTLFSFLIILFVWICSHVQISIWPIRSIKVSLNFRRYLHDVKYWLFLGALFVALNAYWIYTTYFMLKNGAVTPGYTLTPKMLSDFSQNAHPQTILSGTDQWTSWWPGQHSPFIWDLITLSTIALPAILLAAIYLGRKTKKSSPRLLFILVGIWIFGFFFALGMNDGIGLYQWLASSTYGWLLRVPGKISYLLWPAYAVSAAILVQSAFSYYYAKKQAFKKLLVFAVVTVLLVSSMGYAVLKSDDYFNFYYAPVPVPTAYQQAFSYISTNLTGARIADFARYENGSQINFTVQTISFPYSEVVNSSGGNNVNHSSAFWLNYTQPFEASYSWNPNRIAGYFVPRSISAPNFGYYHFTYSGVWEPAYVNFEISKVYLVYVYLTGENVNVTHLDNLKPVAVDWLPVYGANYVFYHNDIFNTTQFANYDLDLLSSTGFELVQQWGGYLYLFRAPESFGRIYSLSSYINESNPPTTADITASGANITAINQVDATQWRLNVTANQSFTLVFTEGYDQYWTAIIQSNGQTKSVPSHVIFGSINSFNITQTGELKITLLYQPQIWLNDGIILTAVLLAAVSAWLVFYYFKKKRIQVRLQAAKQDY